MSSKSNLDTKLDYITEGKCCAMSAIEYDVAGNTTEALDLYERTCLLLTKGLELEDDPEAILTLKVKLASFERRMEEIQNVTDVSAVDSDADDEKIDEEEGGTSGPTWCDDEPDTSSRGVEESADAPSAQLRSSQEELCELMHSKELLETQITDARVRAETYTKSLEEARMRSSLEGGLNISIRNPSPTLTSLDEDSSIVSASTNNTNVAVVHEDARRHGDTAGLKDRVAALERVVKIQQREIIVVNTDLRVSKARSAALQQKLADVMDPKEFAENTRQMGLAENYVENIKVNMRESDTSRSDAVAQNRALEKKLKTLQQEFAELQKTIAGLRSRENDRPLPDPEPFTDNGPMSCASSISTLVSEQGPVESNSNTSHTILRQWRQQARENLAKTEAAESLSDSFEETKGLLRESYSLAAGLGLGSNGDQSGDILMGDSRNSAGESSDAKVGITTKSKAKGKVESARGGVPSAAASARSEVSKQRETSLNSAKARHYTKIRQPVSSTTRRPTTAPTRRVVSSGTSSRSITTASIASARRPTKTVESSARQTAVRTASASSANRSTRSNTGSSSALRMSLSTPKAKASAAAIALDLSLESMGRGKAIAARSRK